MSNTLKSYLSLSIILLLGILIFLPRLDVLPFRGEEPRRVVCAFEMLQSGNWFVPTIQNELFLSRPPLQNWLIAATGIMRGSFDHLAGRLPTLFGVLLTLLVIYFYCISVLTHKIAILASLFFLTMPQVLQLGLTAETELLFTALLSSSFLLWHCGELRQWQPFIKWGTAYSLLALATLTKGINQAPLYFAGIIGIYLLQNRRLKDLFSSAHLMGCLLFLTLVGSWQWGFVHYVGAKTGWLMHLGDVGLRFEDLGLKDYLKHVLVFPLELLAVLLPWSIFLFIYASPIFWHKYLSAETKPVAIFCISALAITFISVWFPPGARTRYYMPLFPCIAILAAIAAETLWSFINNSKTNNKDWWLGLCPTLMRFMLIAIPLVALINFIWAIFGIKFLMPAEPVAHALLYLIGCSAISVVLYALQNTKNSFMFYVLGYSLFAALTMNYLYTDSRKEKLNNVDSQVVSGLKILPKDIRLVSLGPIHYQFLYYYMFHTGKTIPILTEQSLKMQKSPVYFCAIEPFAYESTNLTEILKIKTGRYKPEYATQSEAVLIAKKG